MTKQMWIIAIICIVGAEAGTVYSIYNMFQLDAFRDLARGMLYVFIIINVALVAAIINYLKSK